MAALLGGGAERKHLVPDGKQERQNGVEVFLHDGMQAVKGSWALNKEILLRYGGIWLNATTIKRADIVKRSPNEASTVEMGP